MIDYKEFIDALFDTSTLRRDSLWEERWAEAEKKIGKTVDSTDDDFRNQLGEYFFLSGNYELQEYYVGKRHLAMLLNSVAQMPATTDTFTLDKAFDVQGKNFDRIPSVTDRLKELEDLLFGKNIDIRKMALEAKAESMSHEGPLERRILNRSN